MESILFEEFTVGMNMGRRKDSTACPAVAVTACIIVFHGVTNHNSNGSNNGTAAMTHTTLLEHWAEPTVMYTRMN